LGWSPFRKTGLTFHQPAASVKGYTLATPTGGDASYLLDMAGRIVHRWHFSGFRAFYGRLQANGNLLMLGTDSSIRPEEVAPGTTPPVEVTARRLGGNATHLREVDWDGNLVWEYANPRIHHDFVRLANGNTLLIEWARLPEDVARAVRGGFRERNLPPMLGDDFIEIDASGKEVRRVSLWKLLDPRKDAICPLERRQEWTHTNSIDVTAAGDILFSCRANSRVGLIDKSGAITWKYGSPNVYHQHHASALENGNVQIFDNGMHRPGMPRSAIVEVNPKDSSTVWQYVANPEAQFFSAHISGAERLAGGNVLVCEGAPGRVFEVTRAGEVAWEWQSPFTTLQPGFARPGAPAQRISSLFRAHRYGPDHAALKGRELDPARYADLNRLYGLE
jgi:hypothetical protein